ncbi:MAG: hypothetical protein J5644_10300 [Bacteroidales bacterium]|nr:hypothetical protein [Bacteroidales bacterium]
MANKIKVYGQSQKWTALGIVAAYVKMHPRVTVEELKKAFPESEIKNSIDTVENILAADKSGKFDEKMSKQIGDMDMSVTLKDGTKVAFSNPMWPADKFQKITELAQQYGIDFEVNETEKGPGKRGSYRIEMKKSNAWLWILLAAIVIAIIIAVATLK